MKREDENNTRFYDETSEVKDSPDTIFISNPGGGFGNYFSTMKQPQIFIAAFRLLSHLLIRSDQSAIRRDVGTWQSASVCLSPLFHSPLLICLAMSISNNRFPQRELEFCCLPVNNMIGSLVHRSIVVRTEAVYHRRLSDIFFRLHRDHHLVTTYNMNRFPTAALGGQVSHHLSDLLQLFTPLLPSFLLLSIIQDGGELSR